jgi:predicted Zn-dependent peptidase
MRKLIAVVGLLVPLLAFAQTPDRSRPPAVGRPPSLKLPPIQRLKLSNGLPVLLMEKRGVPVVQVNLLVKADSAGDPPEKSGLTSLMLDLMDEGAGSRSALELADAIDFLGANISTFAGVRFSGVALYAPVAKLGEAVSLMADIAQRPRFAAEELERKRTERLTALLQSHDQPNTIASVLSARTLWGPVHPYGLGTSISEPSIRSVTVEDLKGLHASAFHSGAATIVAVGDISASSLLPSLESAFGKWPQKAYTEVPIAVPKQVAGRTVYLVDKPGSAQSVIRIGRIGAERMTPDYFPMIVMNTILGGSFTSRLNQNLREQHGYSYGAGSSFDFRVVPGPFVAASSVQTAVTDKALAEFMNELRRVLQPPTEEEVMRARNYLALGYPGNFQTVREIAGAIQELAAYGLPDDYLNSYIDRVLAVTKADVERVARKYIDPENLAIIVVGDRKTIEAGIRGLNLGEVRTLSVEDVLGKRPVLQ